MSFLVDRVLESHLIKNDKQKRLSLLISNLYDMLTYIIIKSWDKCKLLYKNM